MKDGTLHGLEEPYLNFADGDVDPSDLFPSGVFGRLAEIRAEVDPESLFRARHTI